MLGELDPTNPDDGRDPYGQEPPSYPGGPPSGVPPPPAAPPAASGAPIPLNGLKIPQALVDAAFPGYKVQGDALVWGGGPQQFARDPAQILSTLKGYADPFNKGDWQGYFNSIYGQRGANQTGLLDPASMKLLQAGGFQMSPANSAGYVTKVQAPNKHWYRVIDGDPAKGGSWSWVDQGDGGPGPNPRTGTGNAIDPSYLSPWDKAFNFEGFQAPNDEELHADPGFKFRRDNAVGAYQNSSAARGLLNSSNAPYDIATLADSLAGQEYGNVFARKFGTWQTNRDNAWQKYLNEQDTFRQNQNSPFDKLFKSSELGLNAAGS